MILKGRVSYSRDLVSLVLLTNFEDKWTDKASHSSMFDYMDNSILIDYLSLVPVF